MTTLLLAACVTMGQVPSTDPVVLAALRVSGVVIDAPIEVVTVDAFVQQHAGPSRAAQRQLRATARNLAAVVIGGRAPIYVFRDSRAYRRAAEGEVFDLFLLASALHHEWRHIEGDDERAAYDSQVRLVATFIAGNRVEAKAAATYIIELVDMRDRIQPARRQDARDTHGHIDVQTEHRRALESVITAWRWPLAGVVVPLHPACYVAAR